MEQRQRPLSLYGSLAHQLEFLDTHSDNPFTLRLPGETRTAPGRLHNDFTGAFKMPWTPNEVVRHTHKATTTGLKELWAKVANESLKRTGDEGRAIREANAVVEAEVD